MSKGVETTNRSFACSGNLIDVHQRSVYPATIKVRDGRIEAIESSSERLQTYLAPGFVDAHVHVESSMLPPAEFARLAVTHGTVATVSDPHEIANVMGIEGVRWMLDDAAHAVLKICFGAPSCVPATPFDHAGATLGAEAVADLLAWDRIGYLSEVMDYPGVIAGQAELLAKLAAARLVAKPIDGHAPRLRGRDLATYAARGITTDHECVAIDEAREKLALDMQILIREGSAAKNFDALWPLLMDSAHRCMLCSDDKHPHDLLEGHIDQMVRRALARGVNLFDAWRAASVNPVAHYRLPVGLLRPGDPADFIEVDSLSHPRVLRTWIDGRLVAQHGRSLLPRHESGSVSRMAAGTKQPADFALPADGSRARVIEAIDGQLVTGELVVGPKIVAGEVVPDADRDILKIALIDRYRDVPPVVALIRNFGLRHGALAGSVSHDSHNVVAVGASDDALARAVNAVTRAQGGLAVVDSDSEATLPLAIAGLMSNADGYQVAVEYTKLESLAKSLGSQLTAPFMTLSFMALLVIPRLKIGPTGLFDVSAFQPVSMWES
jgi:adenine deaminase